MLYKRKNIKFKNFVDLHKNLSLSCTLYISDAADDVLFI
ncbi:hypothetical protein ACISNR_04650, partial [Campylobacter jejuni]